MKTANLKKTVFLLTLTLSAWFAISGNAPVKYNPVKAETEKTIKDYFKFPQVLIAHTESEKTIIKRVEVLFTTNQNGLVNFALAKIEDENLKKEIEKQFSKLKLPKLKSDVVYSVILSFRTV